MGKYIIEVDESEIVECWNEQSVKELGYQEYALKQCPGIKVKSYNPSGDLISRELLKNDIEAQISDFNELNKKGEPYKDFKDIRAILFGLFIGKNLIDNAPTVDIKDEIAGAYNEGYMCGNKEAEKARPQGETEAEV